MKLRAPLGAKYLVNYNHPLVQGRIAWWKALPPIIGGGSLADLMLKRNGTLTNMANSSNGWRSPLIPADRGSLLTDGSAGYINIANSSTLAQALTKFTVGMSFRIASGVTYNGASLGNPMFGKYGSGGIQAAPGWGLLMAAASSPALNGGVGLNIQDDTNYYQTQSNAAFNDGKSHRLVAVITSLTNATLYVDGVAQAATTINSGTPNQSNASNITIGTDTTLYCAGLFDDLFINTNVWTQAMVLEDLFLWKQGHPGVILPLPNPIIYSHPSSSPIIQPNPKPITGGVQVETGGVQAAA